MTGSDVGQREPTFAITSLTPTGKLLVQVIRSEMMGMSVT